MQDSAKPMAKEIKASARPKSGKGAARAVRREGKVPGVVYGGDIAEAETIALDANELTARPLQVGLSMTATIDTRDAAH